MVDTLYLIPIPCSYLFSQPLHYSSFVKCFYYLYCYSDVTLVASWAVVIHFKQPSVGPVDEEGEEVFADIEQLLSSGVSSMSGWAICQGMAVASQGEREEVVAIKESLHGLHQGRDLGAYALILELGKHSIYIHV